MERSLWQIMEKVTCGKPSYTFTDPESMVGSIMIEKCGNLGIDLHLLPNFNWRNGRHWRPAQLRDLEPTTQRALEEKLRQHWSNRLHAADIPAMAAVMGRRENDHEEFLHLLGDARFSTLRQRCLALEKAQGNMEVSRSRGQRKHQSGHS